MGRMEASIGAPGIPAAVARPEASAAERESRLRIIAGVAIGLLLTLAAFGLAWDIRWHALVGRDTFFTPPHIFLYAGVALAGLLSLAMVLSETIRYYRGSPTVSEGTTTAIFRVFHAPLGFIVTGFGILTMLIAAPLDNYWHELYGIDVTLWAPFHVMGLIGGVVTGLGITGIFASEAAWGRRQDRYIVRFLGFTGAELAVLITLGMLLGGLSVIAQPASNQYPTTLVGSFEFMTYPVLLALYLPALGLAAVTVTRRPGAATLVAVFFALRQAIFSLLVPWAVWWVLEDPSVLRVTGWRPGINWNELVQAFFFLIPMAVIDLLYALWKRRRGSETAAFTKGGAAIAGLSATLPILPISLLVVHTVITGLRRLGLPPSIVLGDPPDVQVLLQAMPLALAAGAIAGLLGLGWGRFLRVYDR